MTPRQELLQIQKKIFSRIQSLISSHSLIPEKGFEIYEKQYRRWVKDYQEAVALEELRAEIHESNTVFVGDYHTNKQSQRAFLRLLRWMVADQVSDLVIGLEIVRHKHQKYIDAYLSQKISESEFLKKIEFKKYWYFDLWENFRPIFEFARENHLPVVAIEKYSSSQVSLLKRDQETAALIAQYLESHPQSKMMILMGDLHVSPDHLPRQTQKIFKAKKLNYCPLIIYQNCEEIYWELAEKALEHQVEVVKLRPQEYALMTTPPMIWQQSFLNWLEHEEGVDFEDTKHSFLEILKQIAQFLGITLPHDSEDVEVFLCGDFSFLKWLERENNFSKKDFLKVKDRILSSESYCIPEKKIVYLGNLSLNHAAEEASHYLKYLCSGSEQARDLIDAFYASILHEALGFFGSKIINHKRKCFHQKEYQNLIRYWRDNPSGARRFETEIAAIILQHAARDRKLAKGGDVPPVKYFKMKPKVFLGVTHGLGYILGDQLYYGLLEKKINKQEIKELFYESFQEERESLRVYRRLLKKLKRVKIPKRV